MARFTSHRSRPEHHIAPGSHKDQITTRLNFTLLRDLSRISLRVSHNMMISPLKALVSILLVALTVSKPAVRNKMEDLRIVKYQLKSSENLIWSLRPSEKGGRGLMLIVYLVTFFSCF